MLEEILKYLSVYLLSTVKFFGGPLAGITLGLSYLETVLLTIAGMMTSVVVFSFLGRQAASWLVRRRIKRNKPLFSRKSRIIVKVYRNFGVSGIAFLTPLLLSPVVGTVAAALLGISRKRIFLHMLWSAVLWSFILTFMTFKFQELMTRLF
ncbi:small multi-drug export protein [Pontibacter beigongshangensis]|uniref:small multi-drug export protein n=1 Tax=Pontibacter beigongshangensis TaxID=2574733 RepID=UPI00293BA7AD|nr:small multi-drug export protein [Pontibacter beigongshangensis]